MNDNPTIIPLPFPPPELSPIHRRPRRRWTEAERRQVVQAAQELTRDGRYRFSIGEIAEYFNADPTQVQKLLRRSGVWRRPRARPQAWRRVPELMGWYAVIIAKGFSEEEASQIMDDHVRVRGLGVT